MSLEETTAVLEEKPVSEAVETDAKVEETSVAEGDTKVETEVKSEGTEPKTEEVKSEQKEDHNKPGRWQKRVNKLTREVYDLRSQLSAAQQAPVVKPERASYQSDDQYIEAMTDYKIDQKMPQVKKQMESGSIEQKFTANEEALRAEIEDYDDVIAEQIQLHPATIEAIVSSDLGPRIRYYLGMHPEEAEAIETASPSTAIRLVGKIEAKLEAEMAAKKNPPAQQVSKAKPPIHPVKTAGAPVKTDPNKLSDAEWFKREQELRKQKFKT